MVEIAKTNSFEAGLGDLIDFKQMQVRDLTTKKEYGVIVGNPPYGERLGEKKQLSKCIKRWVKPLKNWIHGPFISLHLILNLKDYMENRQRKNESSLMALFELIIINIGENDHQDNQEMKNKSNKL